MRLHPGVRYTLLATALGVWLSGVLWLIYHYFLQIEGAFGMQKHPMETISLKIHGAFSFASLWIFGALWWPHVLRGWRAHWRRWSGGALTAIWIFLVLSGWGLYYFIGRELREGTSLAHWVVGLAAVVLFFIHWLTRSRQPHRVVRPDGPAARR